MIKRVKQVASATVLVLWLCVGQSKEAYFGGGCFWCMQPPYDMLEGVEKTTVGYMGGHIKNPSYKQVSAGTSGHVEVVRVTYDESKVSYQTLLDVFWRNIDPTQADGQFCDEGEQYRSVIFYQSEEELALAESSKKTLQEKGLNVVTDIIPMQPFYLAETYHQDYYKKNPLRYKFYRYACGRDKRLEAVWGKRG